jgi:hypothetical protein
VLALPAPSLHYQILIPFGVCDWQFVARDEMKLGRKFELNVNGK